jgi:protein SCO1/2
MTNAIRRGLYVFVAAAAIIVGGVVYQEFWLGDNSAGPPIGGPFVLVDQNGVTRRDTDFKGKIVLVYFGYTYCPDTCPTTLAAISNALDILGDKAKNVQPLFISVDPARDSPEQLKAYSGNFSPAMIYLTGTDAQLAPVEHEYQVYVAKVPQQGSDDYLIDHSALIYVMGRDGRYLAAIPAGMPPKSIAASIEQVM